MQWLSNISVRRPVFATVLILVLVVVGIVGYRSLGVDKFPKVDFPLVTIVTPYPGASPGVVETDVSQKVEEAVNTVSGLDTLTSTSTEGVSLVIAQFDLEVNPDKAAQYRAGKTGLLGFFVGQVMKATPNADAGAVNQAVRSRLAT